jgi:hypothetical protein
MMPPVGERERGLTVHAFGALVVLHPQAGDGFALDGPSQNAGGQLGQLPHSTKTNTSGTQDAHAREHNTQQWRRRRGRRRRRNVRATLSMGADTVEADGGGRGMGEDGAGTAG